VVSDNIWAMCNPRLEAIQAAWAVWNLNRKLDSACAENLK